MFINYKCQKATKYTGFTLIELLVVMAIISMLMSMTIPSLNKAKLITQSTVCQSSLRQFHLAWTMYADDNNGKLCASDTEWNGTQPWKPPVNFFPDDKANFWVSDGPGVYYNDFCGTETAIKKGVLWPYIEMIDFYKCNSDKRTFIRSYAISHAMASVYNYNGELNFYSNTDITSPSKKAVFLDVEIRFYRDRQKILDGVGYYGSISPINPVTNQWTGRVHLAAGGIELMTFRHYKGFNMSFADGHCERYKWKDKRSMDITNGDLKKKNIEECSTDNPDIPALTDAFTGARVRQW